MHTFVSTVLLRMAWLDALDGDAQAKPPNGQAAQVEQTVGGGKGHAVVGAHGLRQAAFLEKALKRGKSTLFLNRLHGFAEQEITAGMVGDGQRVAISLVAQHELALVVGAPQGIRSKPFGQRSPFRFCARTRLPGNQAMTIHDRVDGAAGRHTDIVGQLAQQPFPEFASAPSGPLATHGNDHGFELGRELVGIAVRGSRAVGQSLQPALFIPLINFIPGDPGDPELPAQRGHAFTVLEPQHKAHSFFHDGPLLPWHRHLQAGLVQLGGVNHVFGTFCKRRIRTHTWEGSFYPEGMKPADYLHYYSEQFDTVEVDSTYYRIPSAAMVKRWHAQT